MAKLEPTYREALVKSWHFVWHHKLLWVLSLVSVIFTQFGMNDFLGQLWLLLTGEGEVQTNWWSQTFWSGINTPHGIELVGTIWLLIILIALGTLIIVIAVCAQGALIVAACAWFKTRTVPDLKKIWHKGVKHFWRLFTINIIQKICLALILSITTFLLQNSIQKGFFYFLTLSISFLFALFITCFTIYCAGFIVEKEYSLREAAAAALNMFSKHFLVSLELSIILLLLNGVLVVVAAGGSVLVLIPSFFIWMVGGFTGYVSLLTVGVILATVFLLILIALIGGMFNAFITSSWMFLFIKMNTKHIPSRLKHYSHRLLRSKTS